MENKGYQQLLAVSTKDMSLTTSLERFQVGHAPRHDEGQRHPDTGGQERLSPSVSSDAEQEVVATDFACSDITPLHGCDHKERGYFKL